MDKLWGRRVGSLSPRMTALRIHSTWKPESGLAIDPAEQGALPGTYMYDGAYACNYGPGSDRLEMVAFGEYHSGEHKGHIFTI